MVDSGSIGPPEERAREALQRVDNLIRVATSRVIALREIWERRHLQAADHADLEVELISMRGMIERLLDQLLEAWGEYSIAEEELSASAEEADL